MLYVRIESLLKRIPSSFKLVILASQRVIELNEGKEKLVDISSKAKMSNVALEEIIQGKISYKVIKSGSKK